MKLLKHLFIILGIFVLTSCVRPEQSDEPHVHTFSDVWSFNQDNHFHKSTCGHDVISDEGPHIFGEWIIDESESTETLVVKHRKCNICGYQETATEIPHEEIIYSDTWSYDKDYHWKESTSHPGVTTSKAAHDYRIIDGDRIYEGTTCTVCGYHKEVQPLQDKYFTVYASNDFHGAVEEDGSRMGLKYFGSFFKSKSQEENTILLDQGDTWQGSVYSNMNHGSLIHNVMIEAGFDARTVGNHDFDWGIGPLTENTARLYNGKTLTTLAANVYDYDFIDKREGNVQQSNIGVPSYTKTLQNGIKIGVVGTIGRDQMTSITSLYTQNICFKDHVPIIINEAINLRKNGCDFVIASVHAGSESVRGYHLEDYVDLVLCGHTHKHEAVTENGLFYGQYSSYGQEIGEIKFKYSARDDEYFLINQTTLDISDVKSSVKVLDQTICDLVDNEVSRCSTIADEVICKKTSGYFSRNEQLPNLMCQALMDRTLQEGYDDVIFTYCNQARNYIANSYTTWQYSKLYECFPFDNETFIIEVSGKDIYNEVGNYNNICKNPNIDLKTIDKNKKYKIAAIDYLAYHTNTNRYYDYFPSFDGNAIGKLSDNYRVILKEWLEKEGYKSGAKTLYASNFDSSVSQFNKDFNYV